MLSLEVVEKDVGESVRETQYVGVSTGSLSLSDGRLSTPEALLSQAARERRGICTTRARRGDEHAEVRARRGEVMRYI